MAAGSSVPRRYSDEPEQLVIGHPPQKVGRPRAGHGTAYLNIGFDEFGNRLWTGVWIDEFDEPDADGAEYGRDTFEGDRVEAITWVRSQPAAARVVQSQQGWSPLPENDGDIEI